MTCAGIKASGWRSLQSSFPGTALARKLPPSTWVRYGMVVMIALLGSIFLMLQMIGIGLTLWVGAAIAPQWWATAQTYHQMCNQIKDRQWDVTVMRSVEAPTDHAAS